MILIPVVSFNGLVHEYAIIDRDINEIAYITAGGLENEPVIINSFSYDAVPIPLTIYLLGFAIVSFLGLPKIRRLGIVGRRKRIVGLFFNKQG